MLILHSQIHSDKIYQNCALNKYKKKCLKTLSSYFYENLNQGSSKLLRIVFCTLLAKKQNQGHYIRIYVTRQKTQALPFPVCLGWAAPGGGQVCAQLPSAGEEELRKGTSQWGAGRPCGQAVTRLLLPQLIQCGAK